MLALHADVPLKGLLSKLTRVIARVQLARDGRDFLLLKELLNVPVLFARVADDGQTFQFAREFFVSPMLYDFGLPLNQRRCDSASSTLQPRLNLTLIVDNGMSSSLDQSVMC
jgi:hypothetical protein